MEDKLWLTTRLEPKLTLQIILLKLMEYIGEAITCITGLGESAVNRRTYRPRKIFKKISKQRYIFSFFLGYRVNGEKLFTET